MTRQKKKLEQDEAIRRLLQSAAADAADMWASIKDLPPGGLPKMLLVRLAEDCNTQATYGEWQESLWRRIGLAAELLHGRVPVHQRGRASVMSLLGRLEEQDNFDAAASVSAILLRSAQVDDPEFQPVMAEFIKEDR